MNLVLHQFKKDVLHLRWLLVLWAVPVVYLALLAAFPDVMDAGLGIRRVELVPKDAFLTMFLFLLAFFLHWFLPAMIVAALIQEDSMIESSAFWLTRPLSWRVLLAAKGLFCFLFLFLPPMLILWFVRMDSSSLLYEMPHLLFGVTFYRTEFILVLWILAALTRNFAQLVIAGIITAVAWWLLEVGLQHSQYFPWHIRGDVIPRTILVGFSIATICHQYATRRRKRSVCLVAAGAFAYFIAVGFGNFPVGSVLYWPFSRS